jgi:hypothetical protein
MLNYFTSLLTLISLLVLGPPLGQTILRNPKTALVRAIGTMLAIAILLGVYGMIWSARPSSILWYTWVAELPINGGITILP